MNQLILIKIKLKGLFNGRDACVRVSQEEIDGYSATRACAEGHQGGQDTRGAVFTPRSGEDVAELAKLLDADDTKGVITGMTYTGWRIYSAQMTWMRNRSEDGHVPSFPANEDQE